MRSDGRGRSQRVAVVLATLSGGAALALAAVCSRVLRSTLLPQHQWAGGPLDVTAVAFTGVAALVVGLATAVARAVYAARSRGIDRLDGLRGARSLGAPVRTGLILVQAALSLVLLNGAAIFCGSFDAARKLDVGYAKENLLTVRLGTGWGGTLRLEAPGELPRTDGLDSAWRAWTSRRAAASRSGTARAPPGSSTRGSPGSSGPISPPSAVVCSWDGKRPLVRRWSA